MGAVDASPELEAPKRGLAGVVEGAAPKMLLALLVGLAPNKGVEDALVEAPNKDGGLEASAWAGFSGSAGLPPNRVEDCITGGVVAGLGSAGVDTAPKILTAGAAAGLSSALGGAPKRLEAGFAGSATLGASLLGWKRDDPKLG